MRKKFSQIIFAFLLFFLFPQQILAARSLSIVSASKTALFGDEDVTINASASGFTTGETIYIKGAMYQDGGTNYFGFTKSGDNWIKNGDTTATQRQIKIDEWDGNMIFKADFADSGYKGEGNYKLKLGFYYITSNGTISSSVNWSSNNIDLNISEPDPTPTATSSPTKEPTSGKISTSTPSKSPTITPSKSATPSRTPTKSQTKSANLSGVPTSVLGAKSKTEDKSQNTEKYKTLIGSASQNKFSMIAVITGSILLLTCAILIYFKMEKK